MSLFDSVPEATVAGVAQKVGGAGGITAFVGGITANDIAAWGGLLVAVIGLAIQFYYKRRSDRREAELHEERLRELREP